MKKHLGLTMIAVASIAATACKKDHTPPPVHSIIQYQLYTEKDFSANTDSITFRLQIKTSGNNQVIFDSALTGMQIKEIPDKAHMLVFHKEVPANFQKNDLSVGFQCSIKDIGYSWFYDTCKAGQALKIVDFSFK